MRRFFRHGPTHNPLFRGPSNASGESHQAEAAVSLDDRFRGSARGKNFATQYHGHRRSIGMILKRRTRCANDAEIVVADKVVGWNATPEWIVVQNGRVVYKEITHIVGMDELAFDSRCRYFATGQ